LSEILIGPLFDGRAGQITRHHADQLRADLAQEAVNRVHARLHDVLRHPTGRYESAIRTERQVDDLVVTDGGIIYGPWLEGVGSRNYPVTRFRGYHTFREVSQQMDGMAQAMAEREAGLAAKEISA